MAGQRPKRNNSPINSKNQPLKATVPVSSLIRNPSPTRRRTSPLSPGLPPDKRNRIRRSPDVLPSNERSVLSPLGSKDFKPVKKNIRRTSSLETLSTSYINGQWPKENPTPIKVTPSASYTNSHHKSYNPLNKGTQTNWNEEETSAVPFDHRKNIATPCSKVFRQVLQRSKQQSSQPIYGKYSPVQGDHSAAPQQYYSAFIQSKPVTIPQGPPSSPKNPSLHTRRSVEGLNFELEGLDLGEYDHAAYARTPPEGRRPPVPGLTVKNVSAHTQTSNGWISPMSPTRGTAEQKPSRQQRSPCLSISPPAAEQKASKECRTPTRTAAVDSSTRKSPGEANLPKYASSPKPNNSFWFARAPPDGAEKVPLSVEEQALKNQEESGDSCSSEYSCPDLSKNRIEFSVHSPFCSISSS